LNHGQRPRNSRRIHGRLDASMPPLRGFCHFSLRTSGLRHWLNYVAPAGADEAEGSSRSSPSGASLTRSSPCHARLKRLHICSHASSQKDSHFPAIRPCVFTSPTCSPRHPPPSILHPVAVGMALSGHPPHGSVREELPHTALTLGESRESAGWDKDGGFWVSGAIAGKVIAFDSSSRRVPVGCDDAKCVAIVAGLPFETGRDKGSCRARHGNSASLEPPGEASVLCPSRPHASNAAVAF